MSTLVLVGAIAIDLLLGEPPVKLHPVVWMGQATEAFKRRFPPKETASDLVRGGCLVILLIALFVVPSHFIRNPLLEAVLLSTTFSHSYFLSTLKKLNRTFLQGSLSEQRAAMGELVSRDTSVLSNQELLGAAIETAVENITDSIVAPLLFYLVGGLEAAILYRLMNTLDAMIGYRGKYFYYGKIAARLDDLFNFIPARLVALLLFVAGALLRLPCKQAWRVFRRDRNKTDSPNAGQTISAAAGLLGVQLSKRQCYSLGDASIELTAEVFGGTLRLWNTTVWLGLATVVVLSTVH